MTLSKEQIEAALEYLDSQWSGYQVLKETIRTVLQERLDGNVCIECLQEPADLEGAYLKGFADGKDSCKPTQQSEALAALENDFGIVQDLLDSNHLNQLDHGGVSRVLDMAKSAALQRNDLPQWWNTNMDEAPRDGSSVIIEDSFGHIQNYRWAGDVMGGCWQHQNCEETYSNPRFMKQWMPLPEAPKPTGE